MVNSLAHGGAGKVAAGGDRLVHWPLLPNEPHIIDIAREQALTERFLLPALDSVEALLLACRAKLDLRLQREQPTKLGKPYPISQCLEISLAVQQELAEQDGSGFTGMIAAGYAALATFLSEGGSARQVWGDLRGQYFQNAFLIGTLYVDVANDTVVPTKPKVEILPLEKSQFGPVTDFVHYATIARRYWSAHVFPNHLVPELAPWFPLIVATPGGGIRLDADSGYMYELARRDGFRASEMVLDVAPLAPDLFALLASTLNGAPVRLAATAEQGRLVAVAACHRQRVTGFHPQDPGRAARIAMLREINQRLATLRVSSGG